MSNRIIVKDNIVIDADIEDGWIAIVDTDNFHYDDLGAVILGVDQIPALIDSLTRLQEDAD